MHAGFGVQGYLVIIFGEADILVVQVPEDLHAGSTGDDEEDPEGPGSAGRDCGVSHGLIMATDECANADNRLDVR